ncbi:ABC transporter permease [Dolosigranulum pigrum]|uniref:ABC transporter permease n=1 Tax=Dolosigranulum pigrum TaxID=29394 RepID=UPI001AD89ECA|nr:ABC transporter permease [Dolosigranulum pigrum]QTJ55626.1 hypothetical protein FE334_07780 [Dolosigranulum pigrum]
MFKRFKNILWLRIKQYISNPMYIILIALPYLFLWLYDLLIGDMVGADDLLFTVLPLLYTLTMGQLISSIVSEEKEYNNLMELQYSGVKGPEYILSTILYPLLLGILGIALLPMVIGGISEIDISYLSYYTINFLTAMCFALIYISIGMFSETVNQSQIIAIPIMIVTLFLPMGAAYNNTVYEFTRFSFMGSFVELYNDSGNIFGSTSFISLLIWIVGLFVLALVSFIYGFRRRNW